MTKNNWPLIAVALVLGLVYVCFFTSWFRPQTIQIAHTSRNLRSRGRPDAPPALTFALNLPFKLTEIKVVPLAKWQADPQVLPVWHLVPDSDPEPVKIFMYGQHLDGLKPAVPGAHAEPLQPEVVYRLFVTAGKARGQHDFKIGGSPPETK
jgi:hypothetical protein